MFPARLLNRHVEGDDVSPMNIAIADEGCPLRRAYKSIAVNHDMIPDEERTGHR